MQFKQMFDLTGQAAMIMGSSSGVWSLMAQTLAEAGANLIECSRLSEEVVKEIEALGKQTVALVLDVTDPESVGQSMDRALSQFGRMENIINSSGTVFKLPASEISIKQWQDMINSNVTGTFLMCQNQYGKVMNTTMGSNPLFSMLEGFGRKHG